jgi:hypothetical protein
MPKLGTFPSTTGLGEIHCQREPRFSLYYVPHASGACRDEARLTDEAHCRNGPILAINAPISAPHYDICSQPPRHRLLCFSHNILDDFFAAP